MSKAAQENLEIPQNQERQIVNAEDPSTEEAMKEHAVAKKKPSRHVRPEYPKLSLIAGDTDDSRDDEEIKKGKEEWLENGEEQLKERQKNAFGDDAPTFFRDLDSDDKKSTRFLRATDILKNIWPGGEINLDDIDTIIERLQNIPYLGNGSLKNDLDHAQGICNASGDDDNNDGISPKLKKCLASIPDEGARKTAFANVLALAKKEQLGAKKKQLLIIRSNISDVLVEVMRKTMNVHNQLLFLSGLNQAEATKTTCSPSGGANTNESTASKNRKRNEEEAKLEERREVYPLAEAETIFSPILEDPADIADVLQDLTKVSRHDKAENRLVQVMTVLERYLEEATFLKNHDNLYREKVEKGLKALRHKIRQTSMEPEDSYTSDSASSQSEVSSSTATPEEKYAPGAYAHETDGTQPWIRCLLQLIGACWEPDSSERSSPAKNFVLREAGTPSSPYRRKRSVDFLLQKKGRLSAVILDNNMTVPVTAKPGCRGSDQPDTLWNEATNQVLAHLAKHLVVGFNFAGWGVPCHITGIVVSMAAIQILQLGYENVSTPDAKLVLYQSKLMPLMKVEHFQKWTDSAGHTNQESFDTLKTDLYGTDGTGGVDGVGLPLGVRVLFNLMNQPSEKLYGFSVDSQADILGTPIGSGGTAIVFRKKGDAASVIKVSRYGIKRGIKNEREILKKLAAGCTNLPKEIANSFPGDKLQVKLGSVEMSLPAIELSPAGKNASVYLNSTKKTKVPGLRLIFEGINSALKYLHEKKICHCDVTPQNIIIVGEESNARAVLIDFSVARDLGESVTGFGGTPDYTHREIFLKKTWTSGEEKDKAGLGFTMAFFANDSILPWESLASSWELESALENRLERALEVTQEADCEQHIKTEIEKLLEYDKNW